MNTLPLIDPDSERDPLVVVLAIAFDSMPPAIFEAALGVGSAPHASVLALHVVHVAIPVPELPLETGSAVLEESPATSHELDKLRQIVDETLEAVSKAQKTPAPIESAVSHLRIGDPGREIAQVASDLEADLVVVGKRASSQNGGRTTESVAESVARFSQCPILLVPQQTSGSSRIEPPCADCKEARRHSNGASLWCARHLQRYGERHYFHNAPTTIRTRSRSFVATR